MRKTLHFERDEVVRSLPEEEREEEDLSKRLFVVFYVFIRVFDGDIDAWKNYLREKASESQRRDDWGLVTWLEEKLNENPDLGETIREWVEEVPLEEQQIVLS